MREFPAGSVLGAGFDRRPDNVRNEVLLQLAQKKPPTAQWYTDNAKVYERRDRVHVEVDFASVNPNYSTKGRPWNIEFVGQRLPRALKLRGATDREVMSMPVSAAMVIEKQGF